MILSFTYKTRPVSRIFICKVTGTLFKFTKILYGSYGTKYQTVLSDVDFAILPVPGKELDIYRELSITSELGNLGKNEDINLTLLVKEKGYSYAAANQMFKPAWASLI